MGRGETSMRGRCAACGDSIPVDGVIVRRRRNGFRVWTITHECGLGPLTEEPLGFCPRPVGQCQTVLHHVWHGLLMRYPIRSVVCFAWRNRTTFDPSPLDYP